MSDTDFVVRVMVDPTGAVAGGGTAEKAIDGVAASGKKAQDETAALEQRFKKLQESIDPTIGASRRLSEAQTVLFNAQRAGLVSGEETLRLLGLQTAALTEQITPFQTRLAALERETQMMGLSDAEREVQTRLLAEENALRRAGVEVTVEQTAALEGQLRAQQAITAQQAALAQVQRDQRALNAAESEAEGSGMAAGVLGKVAVYGLAAVEVGHLSDEFTLLQNRLRALYPEEAQVQRATQGLYEIAQDTRSSWESTAQIFSRVKQATDELGLSQDHVLSLTKELTEAAKISGASNAEAARGIMDLVHGLSQGVVNTRELKQISAQMPAVMQVLADHFHATHGELMQLAHQGKLTAQEVVKAFDEAAPQLQERFGRTTPTLADGFTELKNAAIKALGEMQPAFHVLAEILIKVGEAIGFAAQHLEAFAVGASLFTPAGPFVLGLDLIYNGVKLAGESIDWLADQLGIGGAGVSDMMDRLKKMDDAINKIHDDVNASMAPMIAWGFLGEKGIGNVNVQAIAASINVHKLSEELDAFGKTVTKITAEKIFSFGDFKGLDSETKDVTRDAIKEMEKAHRANAEAARKSAEEHKRLEEQLQRLEAVTTPLARAQVELQKAETLLASAEKAHIPITQAMLDGLEQRRRKVQELQEVEDRASVASQIRAARREAETKALEDQAALMEKIQSGNNELMQPEFSKKGVDQLADLRAEVDKLSNSADHTLVNAFNHASDALVEFLRTGQGSFTDFVNSVLTDLEKLIVRKLEIALLSKALGLGAAAAGGSTVMGPDDLMAPGFAGGGQWYDRGNGGIDSSLQLFRTSPGERITVETVPQQMAHDSALAGAARGSSAPPILVFDMKRAIAEGIRSDVGTAAIVDVHQRYRDTFGNLSRYR